MLMRTIYEMCEPQHPTPVAEHWSILFLSKFSHGFVPMFARVPSLLNKKFGKDELKTFEKSSDDEVSVMQRQRAKLVEVAVLDLTCLQGPSA